MPLADRARHETACSFAVAHVGLGDHPAAGGDGAVNADVVKANVRSVPFTNHGGWRINMVDD